MSVLEPSRRSMEIFRLIISRLSNVSTGKEIKYRKRTWYKSAAAKWFIVPIRVQINALRFDTDVSLVVTQERNDHELRYRNLRFDSFFRLLCTFLMSFFFSFFFTSMYPLVGHAKYWSFLPKHPSTWSFLRVALGTRMCKRRAINDLDSSGVNDFDSAPREVKDG